VTIIEITVSDGVREKEKNVDWLRGDVQNTMLLKPRKLDKICSQEKRSKLDFGQTLHRQLKLNEAQ